MRITEQSLRRIARKALSELFAKKSALSAKNVLGHDYEGLMHGAGGLYDDPGMDFGESDKEELEELEELEEYEESME